MADIKKEEAEKVLRQNGYTVRDYLGEGACSHAFSCVNPKGKFVAAKVCLPQPGAWASLDDELETAKELHSLKKQFKTDLSKFVSEDSKAKSEAEKSFKHFFKYLTVPKLKKSIKIDGETRTIAIFEAPLADTDTFKSFSSSLVWAKEGKYSVTGGPDYVKLKRVAKNVLKGLQVLHKNGKVHGDIRPANILSTIRPDDGKQIYSITDFGTMKSPTGIEFSKKCAQDIYSVGKTLMQLWLISIGQEKSYLLEHCVEHLHNGDYDCSQGSITVFGRNPMSRTRKCYTFTPEDKPFLDFCKKLTDTDFNKIPTAEDALKHPFLKS